MRHRLLLACLSLAALAFAATAVYPPWTVSFQRATHPLTRTAVDYGWVSASPHRNNSEPIQDLVLGFSYSIDYDRLALEWLVTLACFIAVAGPVLLWDYPKGQRKDE
jgi:hypothetical protein